MLLVNRKKPILQAPKKPWLVQLLEKLSKTSKDKTFKVLKNWCKIGKITAKLQMVAECPHQSLELLDITIIIYYKKLIRIVPSIQFYHAANVAIMVHIRIFNGLACARSVTL